MRMRTTIAWAALAGYLTTTLLPAGTLVQCRSESGHAAIEFAHRDCPEHEDHGHGHGHGEGEGEGYAFSCVDSHCIDTPILAVARHPRTDPEPAATHLQTTAPVAWIDSNDPQPRRPALFKSGDPPDRRAATGLGTVVLIV